MENGQMSSSHHEAAEAAQIKQKISQALEGLNRGIFGVQVMEHLKCSLQGCGTLVRG